MNRLHCNERGVSLIELLVTIVISSFIMLFIVSMYIFIQKQYTSQSTDVSQLTDITIALQSITRDIRSADEVEIIGSSNGIKIMMEDRTISYVLEDDILLKNDQKYIFGLKSFIAEKKGLTIKLYIESTNEKEIETEIVMRGVDRDDGE